ncbi:MAG: hypothetical protein WBA24_08880 [Geitlerinemataceae cyanobacterium]
MSIATTLSGVATIQTTFLWEGEWLHSLKVFACGGGGWSVSTKRIEMIRRLLTKLSLHDRVSPAFKVNVTSP